MAAPVGGQVSVGEAAISQAGAVTNIHQSSQNAAINWQDFSVKAHETVNFHQPNRDSITLNRVVGNELSNIQGAVNANGNVFISNPNGVLIGNGAQINVGGLVATTQKISDDDFRAGKFNFDGASGGKIENLGSITVPKGGVVALIAPIVKNQGNVTASEGKVLLASAESFRISMPNDSFSYTLKRGTLQGLVDNGGAILADGGRVVLTAKGISAVKKSVVKHSGVIEANTVRKQQGVVELLGDLDNSQVSVTGKITAQGKNGEDGGFIETSAAQVKIDDKAEISTRAIADKNGKQGKSGKWLLDPNDLIIADGAGKKPSGQAYTADEVTMSGAAVGKALNENGDFELKSTNGKSTTGAGDVIIDSSIEWSKGTLTLNALNDIHINQTLNGLASAKLALKYGQESEDGGYADYFLQKTTEVVNRNVSVNLPEGKNLTIQKGNKGEEITYDVIHKMPEIKADGSTADFSSRYIALGKNIDLGYTRGKQGFLGWGVPAPEEYGGAYLSLSHFEGLGHRLSNLNISAQPIDNDTEFEDRPPNASEVGLFRCLCDETKSSKVSNLRVDSVNISAPGYWFVGGIVGDGTHLTIKDSYVSGNISGKQQVGGVVGALSHNGLLENVHSNLVLTGGYFVGGLIGEIDGKTERGGSIINIRNSSARALVGGSHSLGGLVGLAKDLTMDNVKATHTHIPNNGTNIGGLIGAAYNTRINEGIFDGTLGDDIGRGTNVGGIIGLSGENIKKRNNSDTNPNDIWKTANQYKNVTISRSRVNANIKGDNRVGGIIGLGVLSEIIDSISFADVLGNTAVGGLFGSADFSTIQTAQVHGSVSGRENVGGLAGEFFGSHMERGSFKGRNVTATEQVAGGLVGASTGSTISESSVQGEVSAPEYSGTAVGLIKLREHSRKSYVFKNNTNNSTSSSGLEIGGYDGDDSEAIGEPPTSNPTTSQPNATLPEPYIRPNSSGGHIILRMPNQLAVGTRLIVRLGNSNSITLTKMPNGSWQSSHPSIIPSSQAGYDMTNIPKGAVKEGTVVSVMFENDNNEVSKTLSAVMPSHNPTEILDIEGITVREVEGLINEVQQQKRDAERILAEAYRDGKITAAERNRIIAANSKITNAKTVALNKINSLSNQKDKVGMRNQVNAIALVAVPAVTPQPKPQPEPKPKPKPVQPEQPQPKPQPKPEASKPTDGNNKPTPAVPNKDKGKVDSSKKPANPAKADGKNTPSVDKEKPKFKPEFSLEPPKNILPIKPVRTPEDFGTFVDDYLKKIKKPEPKPEPKIQPSKKPIDLMLVKKAPDKITLDPHKVDFDESIKQGGSMIDFIFEMKDLFTSDIGSYTGTLVGEIGKRFEINNNILLNNIINNLDESTLNSRMVPNYIYNPNGEPPLPGMPIRNQEVIHLAPWQLDDYEKIIYKNIAEQGVYASSVLSSEDYANSPYMITAHATTIAIAADSWDPIKSSGYSTLSKATDDIKIALDIKSIIEGGIVGVSVGLIKDVVVEKLYNATSKSIQKDGENIQFIANKVNSISKKLTSNFVSFSNGRMPEFLPKGVLWGNKYRPISSTEFISKDIKKTLIKLIREDLSGVDKGIVRMYEDVINNSGTLLGLSRRLNELNANMSVALLAAHQKQKREELLHFFKKASTQDIAKYVAQKVYLDSHPNLNLKGKYLFKIKGDKLERVLM